MLWAVDPFQYVVAASPFPGRKNGITNSTVEFYYITTPYTTYYEYGSNTQRGHCQSIPQLLNIDPNQTPVGANRSASDQCLTPQEGVFFICSFLHVGNFVYQILEIFPRFFPLKPNFKGLLKNTL